MGYRYLGETIVTTCIKDRLFCLLTASLLTLLAATATRAQSPRLELQNGHFGIIQALAISPNDKYLASAGYDKRIILWDIAARKLLYSLKGHSEWIYTLAFSPDGKLLASGSSDGIVKLWNVTEGREEHAIPIPRGVAFVAFSPDGNTLAIACADKSIKLWDVSARTMKGALQGHTTPVVKVLFVDEKRLMSAGQDGSLRLWNLATGQSETIAEFKEKFGSFTYSGGLIARAAGDSITILDMVTRKVKKTIPIGDSLETNAIAFISNKELACATSGLRIWDFKAGKERVRREGTSDDGSYAVAVNNAGDLVAYNDGDAINLFNLSTNEIGELKGGFEIVSAVTLSSDGKALYAAHGGRLGIWGNRLGVSELEAYALATSLISGDNAFVSSANVIAHLERKNGGYPDTKITLIDVIGSKPRQYLTGHTKSINSISVNPEGTLLASSSEDGTVKIWDVKKRRAVKTLTERAELIAYSPDGKLLATEGSGGIKLWNVKTWTYRMLPNRNSIRHILFSPDGRMLAALLWGDSPRTVVIWDVQTGKPLRSFVADTILAKERRFGSFMLFNEIVSYKTAIGPMAFSKDGSFIACEGRNNETTDYYIKIWNILTGKVVHKLMGHYSTIRSVAFSPNGKVLASGSWDKTIRFWDTGTGAELATLVPLTKDDWVIFTPDGRFDTNTSLDEVQSLHWVMPGDALNPLPLDIFMRDYYEPKLLERILAGAALKPVRDISTLNRTQPGVVIKEIKPDGASTAQVTVEVENAVSRKQFDVQGRALQSGVYDIRLFRDGQLVGNSTTETALETYVKATGDLDQTASFNDSELRLWQQAHQVRLDENGRGTLIFRNVKLPQNGKSKETIFSAYAFNNDRVKSTTARAAYALPPAPSRPRKRRAYIVTVGVNLYENPDFNLSYAANDARQTEQALTSCLAATGQYDEVVTVSLISDNTRGEDGTVRTQTDATKANFRAVLRLLSGAGGGMSPELRDIRNADKLKAATPDDLVVILFAGHGFTGPKGLFYLIPYDTGPGQGKGVTAMLQQHSISSDELSLWLRDVDAGHLALIVDACHSAAAVESAEFKPGPMGSRGFGQLAYDKGMLILAATQADNVAIEGSRIRQGLLSYVLVREGLEGKQADFDPADGVIMLREWLQYGEANVPRLFQEIVDGKTRLFNRDVFVDGVGRPRGDQQQPSLFDFARQRADVMLVRRASQH